MRTVHLPLEDIDRVSRQQTAGTGRWWTLKIPTVPFVRRVITGTRNKSKFLLQPLGALHQRQEGKSDPDPPPWTPAIHHPSSATNLESLRATEDRTNDL